MTFADRLLALREGRISFAEFLVHTRGLWRYMAERLLRSRDPGIGVAEEDVRQEMVLECWRCVGRWDPGRGTPIDRYVLFNSAAKAKKWLDAQREACQGARLDTHPNRCPRLGYTDTVEQEKDTLGKAAPDVARNMEYELEARRLIMPRGLGEEERAVVEALIATRNARAAALLIYMHYPYRLRFRLGSERAATHMVRRVSVRLLDEPALFGTLED